MQKKLLLPVAVLSLAMLATACTGPNSNKVGMSPTGQGYNAGTDHAGYNNSTSYNRVTNRTTDYRNNPFDRTNTGTLNRNYTTNRYSGNNWGTTGTGMLGNNYNNTGTGMLGNNYNNGAIGPNNGLTLSDTRSTNPMVNTPNSTAQANHIARMATGVRGVDSAKSLVAGNTVYVGLDISSKITRRNAARVEQEVHRVVSKALPGYDIRITSDRALFRRTGTFFNNDVNNFNNWNRTNTMNTQ